MSKIDDYSQYLAFQQHSNQLTIASFNYQQKVAFSKLLQLFQCTVLKNA